MVSYFVGKMEELLESWGLSQLISKFKENDMTEETIYELNDEMLKELVPSIGLRIILKNKISQQKLSTEINSDFDRMHPNCGLNLYTKWTDFFICVSSLKTIRKDTTAYNLQLLLEEDELSYDSRVVINLTLIIHMLPPKGRITLQKKHWKFSTQECIDSIIIHAKTPGDIERLIEEQKEKCLLRNQPVQPYIIIEGPTIKALRNFYIIIDDIRFKGQTFLQCLDICFKSFFILRARYPVQSEHIWLLLQKGVYKINTIYDKTFPNIVDVIDTAITVV